MKSGGKMHRKALSATLLVAASVALIFGVGSPASASVAPATGDSVVVSQSERDQPGAGSTDGDIVTPQGLTPIYRTVVKKLSSSFTIKSTSLATCTAPAGGTCTFTQSFSVTRTVGLSLGLTRSNVSAAYNFSSATSQTLSVGCTVNTTPGKVVRAYPNGTTYTYQAQKQRSFAPYNSWTTIETSGTLSAFNPTGITCR